MVEYLLVKAFSYLMEFNMEKVVFIPYFEPHHH